MLFYFNATGGPAPELSAALAFGVLLAHYKVSFVNLWSLCVTGVVSVLCGWKPEVLDIYALTREISVSFIDDYGSELRRLKSLRARFRDRQVSDAPESSFYGRMRHNARNSYSITRRTWLRSRLRWFSIASRERAERDLDELLTREDIINSKPPRYQIDEYERCQSAYHINESDRLALVDRSTSDAHNTSDTRDAFRYEIAPVHGQEELTPGPVGFECVSAQSDGDLIKFTPPPEMDSLFKPVYPFVQSEGLTNQPMSPVAAPNPPTQVPPHPEAEPESVEPKVTASINSVSIATILSENPMPSSERGTGFSISF